MNNLVIFSTKIKFLEYQTTFSFFILHRQRWSAGLLNESPRFFVARPKMVHKIAKIHQNITKIREKLSCMNPTAHLEKGPFDYAPLAPFTQ